MNTIPGLAAGALPNTDGANIAYGRRRALLVLAQLEPSVDARPAVQVAAHSNDRLESSIEADVAVVHLAGARGLAARGLPAVLARQPWRRTLCLLLAARLSLLARAAWSPQGLSRMASDRDLRGTQRFHGQCRPDALCWPVRRVKGTKPDRAGMNWKVGKANELL
eukprot:scaffold25665_cov135-Isochrysis_galbana.AAC.1